MTTQQSVPAAQVSLPNGAILEVRSADGSGGAPGDDLGGAPGGATDVARTSPASPIDFAQVAAVLTGISESVVGAIRAARPSEMTVQFGLHVSAKSGQLTSLLVSGDASADLSITLVWRNDDTPVDQDTGTGTGPGTDPAAGGDAAA
ncbi:CU044_2847 family protein [Streptomyces sp. NPDC093252]|uniref:CU044_2847 family protein n=1 Tax=Streptomyces sp. NPDC093252 TaxID=3154980 RepID=UPI003414373C